MGRLQIAWSDGLATFTATASTSAVGFEAETFIPLSQKPFLVWRSTTTGATTVTCDLGADTPVWGAFTNNDNFTGVKWEGATTAAPTSWVSLFDDDIAEDDRVGRVKDLQLFDGTPYRYVRQTPDTIVGGAGYFEQGAIEILTAQITTLDYNFADLRWTVIDPATENALIGGGADVNEESLKPYLRYQFGADAWRRREGNTFATIKRLSRLGKADRVLIHENDGDSSQAYLMRVLGAVELSQRYKTIAASFVLDEWV